MDTSAEGAASDRVGVKPELMDLTGVKPELMDLTGAADYGWVAAKLPAMLAQRRLDGNEFLDLIATR